MGPSYRIPHLYLASDAEKLKQAAPVVVEAGSRLREISLNLVLPSTVGVTGDTGYERKELTVDWKPLPADALSRGQLHARRKKSPHYDKQLNDCRSVRKTTEKTSL